jgi:hypothetical protein
MKTRIRVYTKIHQRAAILTQQTTKTGSKFEHYKRRKHSFLMENYKF